MDLCDNSALVDWFKIRSKIEIFKNLEIGSESYEQLLGNNIDQKLLDEYLEGPRVRKAPGCVSNNPKNLIKQFLKIGGKVAGGAALKVWKDLGEPRDWDIFFDDYHDFINAFLISYHEPAVDVCLSLSTIPYDGFDIWASCCAFDSNGFNIHPNCVEAFKTGKSDIRLDKIIHPVATLRRIVKYSKQYDLRFSEETIQKLISVWKVSNRELVEQVLSFSY